jgi:hypothetical protein
MKRMFFISILLISMCQICFAATTVTIGWHTIELTGIDADWTFATQFPAKDSIKINAIIFQPGAASDKLSIKDNSDSGVEIFPAIPKVDASDGQIVYYWGQHMRPYIDFSASTLSAGHKVIILLAE